MERSVPPLWSYEFNVIKKFSVKLLLKSKANWKLIALIIGLMLTELLLTLHYHHVRMIGDGFGFIKSPKIARIAHINPPKIDFQSEDAYYIAPQPKPLISQTTSLPAILLAIRHCESGDNYTAQNPTSTASGAYQFLDSTFNNYKGYSRAMYAPPYIQDEYALLIYNQDGTTPWLASKSCWG